MILDMPRPVTKFYKRDTDTVFYKIVEDDEIYAEIVEELSHKKSLGDAMFLLKNTIRLRYPTLFVDFGRVEWDRLAKSLAPAV